MHSLSHFAVASLLGLALASPVSAKPAKEEKIATAARDVDQDAFYAALAEAIPSANDVEEVSARVGAPVSKRVAKAVATSFATMYTDRTVVAPLYEDLKDAGFTDPKLLNDPAERKRLAAFVQHRSAEMADKGVSRLPYETQRQYLQLQYELMSKASPEECQSLAGGVSDKERSRAVLGALDHLGDKELTAYLAISTQAMKAEARKRPAIRTIPKVDLEKGMKIVTEQAKSDPEKGLIEPGNKCQVGKLMMKAILNSPEPTSEQIITGFYANHLARP